MVAQVLLICLLVGSAYSRPSVSRKNDEHGNFGYKYEVSHGSGSSRVHLDVGGNKAPRPNKHLLDSDYQAPHHGQESHAPTARGEDGFKHSASTPQESGLTHDPRPSYPSPYDSDSKFSPEYSPPEHTASFNHPDHAPRSSGYEPRQQYVDRPAPYETGPVASAEGYSAGHPGPSYAPEQHVAQQSYQEPIDEPLHQLHDSQQNYQEPIHTPHQQLHAPQQSYQEPIGEPLHQLHDSQQNYQEPINTPHQQLHAPQHHDEGYDTVPVQIPIEPVIVQKEYPTESLPVIAQEGYSGSDVPIHAPVESFPSHQNAYPSSGVKGGLPVQAPIEHEVSGGGIKTIPILTDSKPKYAIIPDGEPYVQIGHTAEIVHGPAPGAQFPAPAPISHSVPLIVDAPSKQVLGSFDQAVAPVAVVAPVSHSIPLPIGAYSKPAVDVVVPEVVDETSAPLSHSIRLPIPYGPHAASDLESKVESAELLNDIEDASDSKDGGSLIAVEDSHIPPVSHAFRLSLPSVASAASEVHASSGHLGAADPPVSHSFPLVLSSGPAAGPQDLTHSKFDLSDDDFWDVDEELAKVQAQVSHSASDAESH